MACKCNLVYIFVSDTFMAISCEVDIANGYVLAHIYAPMLDLKANAE